MSSSNPLSSICLHKHVYQMWWKIHVTQQSLFVPDCRETKRIIQSSKWKQKIAINWGKPPHSHSTNSQFQRCSQLVQWNLIRGRSLPVLMWAIKSHTSINRIWEKWRQEEENEQVGSFLMSCVCSAVGWGEKNCSLGKTSIYIRRTLARFTWFMCVCTQVHFAGWGNLYDCSILRKAGWIFRYTGW